MALSVSGSRESAAIERGASWLGTRQNSDGGFAPRESVAESTWVTALALLAPDRVKQGFDRNRAVEWLLSSTGQESTLVHRLRMRLLLATIDPDQEFAGWPWYPGAAAWVTPTALSILAMQRTGGTQALQRVDQGRKYLLARRCRDFGWNHGSTHALGYDSDSYPETTGTALLALHGVSTDLSASLSIAHSHLSRCRSWEAASWLVLGLSVHGVNTTGQAGAVSFAAQRRESTMEIALDILARATASGNNPFLETHK
jgi:hypothetical protein